MLFSVFCSSCRPKPPAFDQRGPLLSKLEPSLWPEMADELDADSLGRAIKAQLVWLEKKPQYRWDLGLKTVNASQLSASLTRFWELFEEYGSNAATLNTMLKQEFELYQFSWDGSNNILMTGYHAPVYEASRTADSQYKYPLYALPSDLLTIDTGSFASSVLERAASSRRSSVPARLKNGKVLPYFSRKEIDADGALANRSLELVYLADYFQAFSFHVQGGGFVRLPDQQVMRLNYAGSNGQPYVSIGKLMVESGKISLEDISMQALASWFSEHAADMWEVCYQNPSYVFYTSDGKSYDAITPELFPHGVLGFPVTTRRSIATDKRYFPGGGLAYIRGHQRNDQGGSSPFGAFVLDQDTGGAIRENHIDWFLGAGSEAEHNAGLLKDDHGEVFFLLLKAIPSG